MNNAAGKIHCSRSRPRHISNLLPKYTRENSPKSYPRAFRKIERNSRRQSRKWPVHANFVPSPLRGNAGCARSTPGIAILRRLISPPTSNRSSFVVKSNSSATRTKKPPRHLLIFSCLNSVDERALNACVSNRLYSTWIFIYERVNEIKIILVV